MNADIFHKKAKELHRVVNQVIPKRAKNLGVQFFKSRFRAQGWLDESFQPWPKRKKADKKRPGRAILMDRGKLRNSIRGEVRNNGAEIVFGSSEKHARIHNEGGTITHPARQRIITHKIYTRGKRKGRVLFHKNNQNATFGKKVNTGSYTIKMPKRQFMGPSAHLNRIIKRDIENQIRKIFQS